MSKSLPTAPNLEHLKKQAKDLLKSHRTRNPQSCEVLKLLHQFASLSDQEILESKLSLKPQTIKSILFRGQSQVTSLSVIETVFARNLPL